MINKIIIIVIIFLINLTQFGNVFASGIDDVINSFNKQNINIPNIFYDIISKKLSDAELNKLSSKISKISKNEWNVLKTKPYLISVIFEISKDELKYLKIFTEKQLQYLILNDYIKSPGAILNLKNLKNIKIKFNDAIPLQLVNLFTRNESLRTALEGLHSTSFTTAEKLIFIYIYGDSLLRASMKFKPAEMVKGINEYIYSSQNERNLLLNKSVDFEILINKNISEIKHMIDAYMILKLINDDHNISADNKKFINEIALSLNSRNDTWFVSLFYQDQKFARNIFEKCLVEDNLSKTLLNIQNNNEFRKKLELYKDERKNILNDIISLGCETLNDHEKIDFIKKVMKVDYKKAFVMFPLVEYDAYVSNSVQLCIDTFDAGMAVTGILSSGGTIIATGGINPIAWGTLIYETAILGVNLYSISNNDNFKRKSQNIITKVSEQDVIENSPYLKIDSLIYKCKSNKLSTLEFKVIECLLDKLIELVEKDPDSLISIDQIKPLKDYENYISLINNFDRSHAIYSLSGNLIIKMIKDFK